MSVGYLVSSLSLHVQKFHGNDDAAAPMFVETISAGNVVALDDFRSAIDSGYVRDVTDGGLLGNQIFLVEPSSGVVVPMLQYAYLSVRTHGTPDDMIVDIATMPVRHRINYIDRIHHDTSFRRFLGEDAANDPEVEEYIGCMSDKLHAFMDHQERSRDCARRAISSGGRQRRKTMDVTDKTVSTETLRKLFNDGASGSFPQDRTRGNGD